jgi:hypothetical protein
MATDDSAWYIELPVETDELTMADDAVDALQSKWDGWEPNDGDLEVVLIEALASLAAPVARQAALGTEEIFRIFGVELVGVPYQDGSPATTTVTFTLTDTELHTVPDGSEIDIDGVAFLTYAVHALPGYDLADLQLRIDAMLADWLSPAGFATSKFGDPGVQIGNWIGTNIVRKNSVIDRIGDVEGVDYIDSVTLSGGTPVGTGDVQMAGTVALPRIGVVTGTVSGPP